MKLAFAAAGVLIALSAPAFAQETAAAPAAEGNERVNQLIVYGDDPCPQSTNDQINVCARKPEGERYRIPEALRDDTLKDDPASTSWAQHAQSLEYAGRAGIQSCSTVGPGGFTGCWAEMMRAARNDRRVEGEPGR